MIITIVIAAIIVAILVAIAAVKHHERKMNERIESQRRETILKIIEHTSSIYDEISRYK